MEIDEALRATAQEDGLSGAAIAVAADATENSAKTWLSGATTPGGDKLLLLMRRLPNFARRLGFGCLEEAA
jgi:hypothetical protein